MRRIVWAALLVLIVVAPRSPGGPTEGEARRGVLRVGVTPLGSLDPAQARSVEQVLVADQLFDSLTAYDPRTLEPVPSLASTWEATGDQRNWTFRLRPGAVFANGRPVVAADVKYSLERVARRGSGSPGADLLRVVTGYGAYRSGDEGGLRGVTTPAADVVGVALDEPLAVLPSLLASPVLSVVPREAVEEAPPDAPFAEAPVGSGPFRIAGVRGPVLSLEPSPGARVALGGIEVEQYADGRAAYAAFTSGRLDWARVPPDEVAAAARRYGREGFRPYLAEILYGFNLRSPRLADVRLREAVVRAVDRRAVVTAVYQGTVSPATSVTFEGLAGFAAGGCERCGFDRDRARRLLAEAFPPGAGPPPALTLDYDDDPTQEALARAVQASLAEVGIALTLRPNPPDSYDERLVSGDHDLFRLGWIAAYPSMDAVLTPLFRSGSPDNLTGYADAAVDGLLAAARAEPDPARRAARYQEAERVIMDDVPIVPLAQLELHAVVSPRVRGLVVTPAGTFDASVVTVVGR